MNLINEKDCVLIAIDFQEKLVGMLENRSCANKMKKLLITAKTLNIPTIVTEQYPKGLGFTIEELDISHATIVEKTSFSALQQQEFADALVKTGRKQVIIGGIETHICVHQTVSELIDAGFEVFVVKDACASRNRFEFEQGLQIMRQNGAKITSMEIVLFELLRSSRHPYFKILQSLIK